MSKDRGSLPHGGIPTEETTEPDPVDATEVSRPAALAAARAGSSRADLAPRPDDDATTRRTPVHSVAAKTPGRAWDLHPGVSQTSSDEDLTLSRGAPATPLAGPGATTAGTSSPLGLAETAPGAPPQPARTSPVLLAALGLLAGVLVGALLVMLFARR